MTETVDRVELRATARRLLEDRSSSKAVRTAINDSGTDEGLWAELVGQGWAGIAVPEELGGVGLGWNEAAILCEEAGRHLAPVPLLSTTLAVAALLAGGSAEQQARWLPGLAQGSTRATLALGHDVGTAPTVRRQHGRVTGSSVLVLDGATADMLFVPAVDDDGDESIVAVRTHVDGVEVTSAEVMDLTRPMADVTFAGAAVDDVLLDGAGLAERIRLLAVTLLAAEQVGVAGRALDEATEHAQTRLQFGRPIGSFQAVKHRLAEMLVRLEAARSVARHAAAALAAGDDDEVEVAAPMAASLCAEVACRLTGDSIQVHGGIGFTWEHDAHLSFKRAEASRHLFGSPDQWRRQLADRLGLQPATA